MIDNIPLQAEHMHAAAISIDYINIQYFLI